MTTQPNRFVCNAAQDSAQDAQNFVQAVQVLEGELVEEDIAPQHPAIPHGAPYTSQELAQSFGIADSTLRTRWLPWINRVAPVELLVDDAGYTELARSLFTEFAQLPSKKTAREQWVTDAKARYSREFMPGGVTPEGVSEELGGALALLRDQGSKLQTAADEQLQALQALINQQAQVEDEFDQAEVAAMRAAGAKRGVMRFQIEAEEEDAAYYQLRKLRAQKRGGQSPQGKS